MKDVLRMAAFVALLSSYGGGEGRGGRGKEGGGGGGGEEGGGEEGRGGGGSLMPRYLAPLAAFSRMDGPRLRTG